MPAVNRICPILNELVRVDFPNLDMSTHEVKCSYSRADAPYQCTHPQNNHANNHCQPYNTASTELNQKLWEQLRRASSCPGHWETSSQTSA